MIQAGLEFPSSARQAMMEALLSLPERIRPTRESDGEDETGSEIGRADKFVTKVSTRETGLFLKNSNVLFDISFAGAKPIRCNGFLDVDPPLVESYLIHMASAQPIFGFACAPEEREHRNRVVTKQGLNTIESWVGRDIQKYIPGLYWLTLIPDSLAKKHCVSLSALKRAATRHMEPVSGQHLFRLYGEPSNWRSATNVTDLVAMTPGIFDVEKIRPQLESAATFADLSARIREWR